MYVFDTDKLSEIFCDCHDFCQVFRPYWQQHTLPGKYINKSRLDESELMTILLFYHLSGFKCFKYYYQGFVLKYLHNDFPNLLSYSRFIEVIPSVLPYLYAYVNVWRRGETTGIYYVDSAKLPVCHNLRIFSHKVFDNIARRGKTSVGWFFGLKIHLIINQVGELMRVLLTPGNVSDKNCDLLEKLATDLQGLLFGDRGYVSKKAADKLREKGLKLIYKFQKNMKDILMPYQEKILSRKRGIVETVIDLLKNICNIDHTRHRSPLNAITHIFAGVAAYTHLDHLPSISYQKLNWLDQKVAL
jgi:hypothetical protein